MFWANTTSFLPKHVARLRRWQSVRLWSFAILLALVRWLRRGEMDQLRRLNFGVRALRGSVDPDVLEREIARYDPHDAAEVSRRIRESAGREKAIDQIVALYHDVVSEFETTKRDPDAEARAEATYLQQLAMHLEGQRNTLLNSQTFRLRKRLLNLPVVGSLLRSLVRKF